jgi:hypothetical protein
MICSLVIQLSRAWGSIPASIQELHEQCRKGMDRPCLHDLMDVFTSMCSLFPSSIYIVIDALDECAVNERRILLKLMAAFAKQAHVHLFVSSRPEPDITSEMGRLVDSSHRVDLQASRIRGDIESYIKQRLDEEETFRRWGVDGMRMIETRLSEDANGMYVTGPKG